MLFGAKDNHHDNEQLALPIKHWIKVVHFSLFHLRFFFRPHFHQFETFEPLIVDLKAANKLRFYLIISYLS
jgi:hypothetical protein